jgi:hypothetical protein
MDIKVYINSYYFQMWHVSIQGKCWIDDNIFTLELWKM